MKANKGRSTEGAKHHYMKRNFFLENRFWFNNTLYSEQTRERLDQLAISFSQEKRPIPNLITRHQYFNPKP
jgi:hypothetical protein